MNPRFRLAAFICACLAAAGCSSAARHAVNEQPAAAAPNVPAPVAAPALPGLPAPDELAALLGPASRSASYTPLDLVRQGAAFEPALPHQRVTAKPLGAAFDPQWQKASPDSADLAYAMFAFSVKGYGGNARFYSSWIAAPPDWGDVYFALANWQKARWDWYHMAADGSVDLPGTAQYIDFGGALVACVLVIDTNPCELGWLRLGSWPPQPDLAATPDTGLTPITVEFDASGSSDPDGDIAEYRWDPEGDGSFDVSTGGDPAFSFEYTGGGPYQPAVRAIDNSGVYADKAIELNVFETFKFSYGSATFHEEPAALVVDGGEAIHVFGDRAPTVGGNRSTFYSKLTPAGQALFARRLANGHLINDAIAGPDGTVYSCGSDSSDPANYGALLQKWSAAGELQWSKTIRATDSSLRFSTLLIANGGLYAGGRYYLKTTMRYYGFLVRLDLDGNIVWARTLIGTYWMEFNDMSAFLPAVSGTPSIRLCGERRPSATDADCLYASFDLDGNLLDCKYWGSADDDEYGRVISTQGKTVAFTVVGADVVPLIDFYHAMVGRPGSTTVMLSFSGANQVQPLALLGQTVALRKVNFNGDSIVLSSFDNSLNFTPLAEIAVAGEGSCSPSALAPLRDGLLLCGELSGPLPDQSAAALVVQPTAIPWVDLSPSVGSPSQLTVSDNGPTTTELDDMELNRGEADRDALVYFRR